MIQKEKILLSLILLFFLTLFFPKLTLLTIIAAAAVVGYSLLFSSVKAKWTMLKERRYLQGMLLFFAWIVTSVLLSENFNKGLSFLDPRLALFYFPLCVGTLELRKNFRNKVLLGVAVLTTVMMLVCLGYGLHRSHFFQQPEFLYNDALTEVLGQQSIYIALLVNLSIYIFAYFILFQKSMYRGWLMLAVLFLFGMSYLLASRIMMGVLCTGGTIGFCYVLYLQPEKVPWKVLRIVHGLADWQGFSSLNFSPNTLNRFKELAYTDYNYQSLG
jgi:O-antigen ligase